MRRPLDPPPNPIAKQAEAAGESIPLGATAADLIARGYDIPEDVPARAVLREDVRSPTGYAWKWAPLPEEERMWALAT